MTFRMFKAKRALSNKESEPAANTSKGLFQFTGGLFSSNVSEAQGKKNGGDTTSSQGAGLFSNNANAGSLFQLSSGFKFSTGQTSTQGVFSSTSLFGGPTIGATSTGGLFGGQNAANKPLGSLFSQGSGSLFGAPIGGGLFNNTTPLFGGQNSLFGGSSTKKEKEDEDGEDGEDGDDDGNVVAEAEPDSFNPTFIPGVTDKPVELKIKSQPPQQSPYSKEFSKSIEKFKILPRAAPAKKDGEEEKKGGEVSQKVTMGKGFLSIESAMVNEKPVYLVVFRNMIGKTLFQGSITAQHAKKRRIEEKAMKLQLKLALLVRDDKTKQFRVEYVVASFSHSDDLKTFEEKFDKAIETLKAGAEKKTEQ